MFDCVYIYEWESERCLLMYSPTFMRFLIGRDADDFVAEEKEKETLHKENILCRCAKYATIPIEIKIK